MIANASWTEDVVLATVCGSVSRGDFQDDWSDIDTLLVCEDDAVAGLVEDVRAMCGRYKILSTAVLTVRELQGGYVPPKIDFVLREINAGHLTPVVNRIGQNLPTASPDRRLRAR
jgi:hypothetical protein